MMARNRSSFVGKWRNTVPIATPARLATSSVDADAPFGEDLRGRVEDAGPVAPGVGLGIDRRGRRRRGAVNRVAGSAAARLGSGL